MALILNNIRAPRGFSSGGSLDTHAPDGNANLCASIDSAISKCPKVAFFIRKKSNLCKIRSFRTSEPLIRMPRKPIATLFSTLFAVTISSGFPTVYNSEPQNPSPIPAEEALKKLKLPEGFKATLFASEPEVQNPIAAAWDRRGRMWVAENYTYAEKAKRFDLAMNDRLTILEDKDHDGKAETRKVFADNLQMLTSVEVGKGGVWLMCPPQLLFIPDANEDDVPDGPPQVILDGFTVAKDNYHNFANGLRWGLDGWLYGRCGHACPATPGIPGTSEADRPYMKGGIWRYHPERKTIDILTNGAVNSWGHDWDQYGEGFFINTVIGHLWHLIPGAHFIESGSSVSPNSDVYERMQMIADHWHFDTNGKWQDSRDGKANDFGGGHAHIGAMIYQADQWPANYKNKLFTLNMHGRRANIERLERKDSSYVGKHEPDAFFSDDPWFRGIEITTGPDGSAYILDWSDTGECHDLTGVHRTSGRIFKISYGDPKPPALEDLATITPDSAERMIRSSNVWFDRQLRVQLLSKKPSPEVAGRILEIARNSENSTVHRLRALWTSHAIGNLEPADALKLLDEKDEHLRVWGIRFLTDAFPQDTLKGSRPVTATRIDPAWLKRFVALADTDPSGLVKLTLASTLQRLPVDKRLELAIPLAKDPALAGDANLPFLIWYGCLPVAGKDSASLIPLAAAASSPKLASWIGRYLATRIETSPAPLNQLLGAPISADNRAAILDGITDAFAGISKAAEPPNWKSFAASITDPKALTRVSKLSLIFGDTRTLDDLRVKVADPQWKLGERQAALDILIDAKAPELRQLCESVLSTPGLNGTALRGLALSGDPAIATRLTEHFADFLPADQSPLFDVLVSRVDWANILLDQIAAGRIPKTALPAFSARRIVSLNNPSLTQKLTDVWGSVSESAGDKQKAMTEWKAKLSPEALKTANLKNGRQLFAGICGACHTLYGEGGKLGPDLTGSGRNNLDYLLENILDPSAVVSADYRITTLTLSDGRTVSGVIAGKTDRTLTLRLPTGESTLETSTITKQDTTAVSLMPEGLLTAFQPDQVKDLIAYLMHPTQVDP